MTIRMRLIGLVAVINLVLVLSIVYVNIQSSRLDSIREEQVILDEMLSTLNAESSGLLGFLMTGFNTTIEKYRILSEATNEAFIRGEQDIVLLPTLGEEITKALQSVFRLNDLMVSRRAALLENADVFWNTAEETYLYIGGVSLFRILTDDVYHRDGYESILDASKAFITSHSILHDTIISNVSVLNDQMEIINGEIARITRRQTIVMNLGIGGTVLLSIILSTLIIRTIIRKIRNLMSDIAVLSTGDLTVDIDASGSDELSELAGDINSFISHLRGALGTIQAGSQANTQARNDLLRSVDDSAGSVEQGEKNVDSILQLTETLDQSVQESAGAADLIVTRVESFGEMIQSQVTMVEESTAAMTEITASLGNMSRIVGANREAATKLGNASREGSDKIEETGDIIRRVGGHVNAIQEMADVIKGVADQTNLLAMNAAIEAAHAGDAGRGFGVVADEIRKLAETTAENSRVISENLRAIIDDIHMANASSGDTISSFQVIDTEVKGVIDSLSEVASSIEELGQGGSQVMEAMNELQDYTSRVKETSSDISENIHSVRNAVGVASDVSRQVNVGSAEIRTGMAVIRVSAERTRDVADSIKSISLDLDQAVRHFRTEAAEQDGEGSDAPAATGTPSESLDTESPDTESPADADRSKAPQTSGAVSSAVPDTDATLVEPIPAAAAEPRKTGAMKKSADGPKAASPRRTVESPPKEAPIRGAAADDPTASSKSKTASAPTTPSPGIDRVKGSEKAPDTPNSLGIDDEETLLEPKDYSAFNEKAFDPQAMERPPELSKSETTSFTIDVDEGVTLSEGDWPGKDELVVVDEEGRPEES